MLKYKLKNRSAILRKIIVEWLKDKRVRGNPIMLVDLSIIGSPRTHN